MHFLNLSFGFCRMKTRMKESATGSTFLTVFFFNPVLLSYIHTFTKYHLTQFFLEIIYSPISLFYILLINLFKINLSTADTSLETKLMLGNHTALLGGNRVCRCSKKDRSLMEDEMVVYYCSFLNLAFSSPLFFYSLKLLLHVKVSFKVHIYSYAQTTET